MEVGWIDTPQDWRDVFIMCFTIAGTVVFLVGLVFTIVIGFLTTSTLLRVRRLLRESVQPSLQNIRQTTGTMRGTVEFVSEKAVSPVVKVYGVAAGTRRFVAVIAGLRRGRQEGK
jgi:hypothetical protein